MVFLEAERKKEKGLTGEEGCRSTERRCRVSTSRERRSDRREKQRPEEKLPLLGWAEPSPERKQTEKKGGCRRILLARRNLGRTWEERGGTRVSVWVASLREEEGEERETGSLS